MAFTIVKITLAGAAPIIANTNDNETVPNYRTRLNNMALGGAWKKVPFFANLKDHLNAKANNNAIPDYVIDTVTTAADQAALATAIDTAREATRASMGFNATDTYGQDGNAMEASPNVKNALDTLDLMMTRYTYVNS